MLKDKNTPTFNKLTIIISALGLIVAVISIIFSYKSNDLSIRTQEQINQIHIKDFLDEAWDLIGGCKGSVFIDNLNHNSNDLEKAKRLIIKALIISPNNSEANRVLGVYYVAKKEIDKAEKCLEKAYLFDKNNYYILIDYGNILYDYSNIYCNNEKHTRAIEILESASKICPKDTLAYSNLKSIYLDLSYKYLNLEPEMSKYYKNKADSYSHSIEHLSKNANKNSHFNSTF